MNKNDVEMEDPEKLPNDSGNSLQESKSVAFGATVGSEVEKSSCAAAVLGDINEREDDGEDLTKCRTEVKDQNELKTEVNPQIKSEVNRTIEGSVSGNINIKGENVNTIINTVEKTASVSPVEKQIDAKKQVVAQKATSGGVEENMSESGVDRRNVEERPSEDVTEKQPKEQTAPVTPVEKHIDAKNEVVAQKATSGGVEENMPFENVIEGGDHRKNVEERANEDVAEKLPKEIGKEDMDHSEHVVGGDLAMGNAGAGDNSKENSQLLTELSANNDPQSQDAQSEEVGQGEDEDTVKFDEDETIKDNKQDGGAVLAGRETDGNENTVEIAAKNEREESSLANQNVAAKSKFLFSCSSAKTEEHSGDIANRFFTQSTTTPTGEADDGTPEDQAAFMKELESFHQEKAMDFKPPKFYGQQLNCLKLWRAVIRLGGYDKVTGSKLWRQVGESFHPPKTCTTVSWTFRIFYEKSLLEYERHKIQSGELQLPVAMLSEVSGADGEGSGSGSGRARRDAAARYMQGWHAQSLPDSGEDKNLNDIAMHEKDLKSIGSLKQKRPNEVEHPSKAARIELSKQSVASVVDIGPPADWVKINVRQNTDCFEVYALVPGLLREEVRVQSDPAGRVVITGQPGQVDNPWGITPFKKVVCLPARIDPVQTSAVVSLHGRLFIRVPFEQPTS